MPVGVHFLSNGQSRQKPENEFHGNMVIRFTEGTLLHKSLAVVSLGHLQGSGVIDLLFEVG